VRYQAALRPDFQCVILSDYIRRLPFFAAESWLPTVRGAGL
jgi:hypothetical protein